MSLLDLFGYLASGVVLLSFLMKDIRKLRWLSIVGCTMFIVYGFLIDSVPVIVTNVAISSINLWHLFVIKDKNQLTSKKD